jgi:hypothetical protein
MMQRKKPLLKKIQMLAYIKTTWHLDVNGAFKKERMPMSSTRFIYTIN